jgi:hypothetical protein
VKGKLSVSFKDNLKSPAVDKLKYSAQKRNRSQMAEDQVREEDIVNSGDLEIP